MDNKGVTSSGPDSGLINARIQLHQNLQSVTNEFNDLIEELKSRLR